MFEELLNETDYRWPKKGDRLLKPSGPIEGVYFAEDRYSREAFLWTGYMLAGEKLVEACLQDHDQRHYLIYPILFNYRHGIEIAMKWTLNRYGRFASINEYDKNHRLADLWKAVKIVMAEVGGDTDQEADNAVESVIRELDRIDPGSFAFRYAETKGGADIKLPPYAIDLANMRDVMKGVDHFFNGLDGLLDANSSSGYFDR
ncbi:MULTISPECIES: hypothetical protein [unclassified Bradyrhizobium]|uniref:hypothetical protein n=1 Tax=unclassified Bradyrhizobium TaxID=2631580 RepID=UPI001CD20A51|nr:MULTISPECIES: hypothetical protein [unclassified Bradyrhizobium]MCA1377642.1 hypothetical protein [Bradyrhizobium sp. IC4060]MCA1483125.1 hypothetical protein [Bradyrhizobium sp. IC4061]